MNVRRIRACTYTGASRPVTLRTPRNRSPSAGAWSAAPAAAPPPSARCRSSAPARAPPEAAAQIFETVPHVVHVAHPHMNVNPPRITHVPQVLQLRHATGASKIENPMNPMLTQANSAELTVATARRLRGPPWKEMCLISPARGCIALYGPLAARTQCPDIQNLMDPGDSQRGG
eukprot:gene16834-biopygen12757